MKNLCLISMIFISSVGIGQNLVNNPGFESYSMLPSSYAQWNLATGWSNCGGTGSPDYAHMLGTGPAILPNNYFATVYPHSGDAIMGFILWHYSGNFREYVSTSLTSALVPGQTYDVSFWITNGGFNGAYGGFACDQMSVAFTTSQPVQAGSGYISSVTTQYTYPGILQDSLWRFISFQFTPSQAFTYITFGNFTDDASTTLTQYGSSPFNAAYYFIDDIEVKLSNTLPVAIFAAANDICPGTCTNFTNLSTNATSYLWSFPGATPSTSVDTDPQNICYNSPGQYDVELIATNINGSDTLLLPNYITVFPYPAPQGISQTGDTLFANSGAVSYQWYFNGTLLAGATNSYYVATQDGDYNVIATDANGCEVEAVIFNVHTFIQSHDAAADIEIFPGLTSEAIIITSRQSEINSVKVFNALGEEILNDDYDIHRGSHELSVGCAFLSPGMYFIQVVSGSEVFTKKFIRQ